MHQGDGARVKVFLVVVLQINSLNDDEGISLNVLAHSFGWATARIKIRGRGHAVAVQFIQVANDAERRLQLAWI